MSQNGSLCQDVVRLIWLATSQLIGIASTKPAPAPINRCCALPVLIVKATMTPIPITVALTIVNNINIKLVMEPSESL